LGLIVLPLMIFHQIQLMACAVLARRYARAAPSPFKPDSVGAAIATGRST
jgi:sodium/bile acid cotransporter 7